MFKFGFIEETEVKFCRDRRPRRSTPQGFGDHKPSVNGPSGTPVPTRRVPHGGCSVSTNTPTNPNLKSSNRPPPHLKFPTPTTLSRSRSEHFTFAKQIFHVPQAHFTRRRRISLPVRRAAGRVTPPYPPRCRCPPDPSSAGWTYRAACGFPGWRAIRRGTRRDRRGTPKR